MNAPQQSNTRRDFFLRPLRWIAAATIAGSSTFLLGRRSSEDKESCCDPKGRIGCRDCSMLSGCGLPRGLSFKQFLSRKDA